MDFVRRSLGVIIYEMVYGRPPWEYKCPSGRTLEQYFDQIAASVADNCLQRDSPSDITISADLDSLIKYEHHFVRWICGSLLTCWSLSCCRQAIDLHQSTGATWSWRSS